MRSSSLFKTREMLRDGEASLRGRVALKDQKVLSLVDEEVRKVVGEIDALFQGIFDNYDGTDFADLFSGIYSKMAKGYLRAKRQRKEFAITADELDAFWTEVQEVIELFNEHGVRVDAPLLESVMTHGGLTHWKEFFEKEFASFASTPWILRNVAVGYKDPRAFLRRVEADVTEILGEKEFAGFTGSPWIVRDAAVKYKDPRAFLRSGTWKNIDR
ncbi:MAG: hypothetical protein ACI9QC_000807 [Oceanicoccus sp.]|jgi:hypothetical protein